MYCYKKYLAIAIAITSLSGCLKVKDNNNNAEVVSTLQQQNEILKQQNEAKQASISLIGTVTNITTEAVEKNATITVKIGNTWSEAVTTATDGSFELTKLPFKSDYTVLIKSTDNSFLSRTYYGTTRDGTTGVVFQDMGLLKVEKGQLASFTILESESNDKILGIKMYSFSHVVKSNRVGAISDIEEYYHRSVYNKVTEQYEIMLPKSLSSNIYSSLDLNNDGKIDYIPEGVTYYQGILINISKISDISTYYLVKQEQEKAYQSIELRISVLDRELNSLNKVVVAINDDINGKLTFTFDEKTQQYVGNVKFNSAINVLLPAITINDQRYNSERISISRVNEQRLEIRTSYYTNSNYHTSNLYYVPDDVEVLDIVIQPELITNSAIEIAIVSQSTKLSTDNTTYKAFYSQPIQLTKNSVSLIKKNVLFIVKGDDDDNDLILPGTTLFSKRDLNVATIDTLSLNNTLVTVIPKQPLVTGFEYQYIMNELIDGKTKLLVNINNDNSNVFTIKKTVTDIFDIQSIQLDNNNYYTNGQIITPQNTAGELSTRTHQKSRIHISIPESALSMLTNLTLKSVVITENGIPRNDVNTYNIIENSQLQNLTPSHIVKTADNETIEYDNTNSNILRGFAITDSIIMPRNTYIYLYDNTVSSENSITFEYAYQTISGEVVTGNITLPVL
ncbi:MAG: hypothetical protein HRU24_01320 [Gammaproteobacteria bacterium]|nr:hypothetical protein [Gammaproteobacteria bacterium]